MRILIQFLLSAFLVFPAQAQLQTNLLDDYNRNDSEILEVTPTSPTSLQWSEAGEAVGSGSDLTANQTIRIRNEVVDLQAGQQEGVKTATVDMSNVSGYPQTLDDAGGVVTWAFNVRQSKRNPGGFGDTGDGGVLFAIAANGTNLEGSANTFAVLIGDGDDTDAIKLVNYNGGYSSNGDFTKIVEATADRSNEYVSVKVTYDNSTSPDTWTLYARSDANGFPLSDPRTLGESDQVGQTQQNFEGTSNQRKSIGLLWDHGATSENAVFDDVYVTDPGGRLPVELATFEAAADGDAAHLRWETVSETQNAGFEVQRDTRRGFETIGFVEGAGTTTESIQYTYTAEGLSPGAHSFRLKQVDLDGGTSIGPERVVTLRPDGLQLATTGPNPVREGQRAAFRLTANTDQAVAVTLHDVLGRTVRTLYDGRVGPQGQDLSVSTSSLSAGMYFVRVQGTSGTATRRVTVAQ